MHVLSSDIEEVGGDVHFSASQDGPRPVDSPLDEISMTCSELPNGLIDDLRLGHTAERGEIADALLGVAGHLDGRLAGHGAIVPKGIRGPLTIP